MMFTDTYQVVSAPGEGLYKDRGSKFLGYAFPVQHEEDVKMYVQQLKKEHFAAVHHCYAYVLLPDQSIQKSNDDREPSNSAGKPILRSILSKQLTNTLVVVVRYFGGKLLGVPGLIQAYGEAATDALNHATLIEKTVTERHRLEMDHQAENEAFKLVKQYGLKMVDHQYGDRISIIFEVRKSMAAQVLKAINDKRLFETTFLSEQ